MSRRQLITILTGLMIGLFLAALDQTIVASAMRVIADDLGDFRGQAWATTAYLVTSTIIAPLYSQLSDIYGRRRFLSAAILVFIIGSGLCATATSMSHLAAFRAVQGLGAGGLFALALAVIGDIVDPRDRARYQGYFLAVFGIASVLGPVIGGFFAGADQLLSVTGWRWVFLINVPISLLAWLLVILALRVRIERHGRRIDWGGPIALLFGVAPLLVLADQGQDWGWQSRTVLLAVGLAVVGVLAFIVIEWRMGEAAILPVRLIRNRTMVVAAIASVLLGIGMFGGLASIPLYLQIVRGEPPTRAGLMLVPMTVGITVGSLLSGRRIAVTGHYRRWPIIGTALTSASFFVLQYAEMDTPDRLLFGATVCFGLGLGLSIQALTLAAQNALPPQDTALATASATFTRQVGGTVGTAGFLSVFFNIVPDRISAAMSVYGPDNPDFQRALKAPQGDPSANVRVIRALLDTTTGGSTDALNPLADSSFINRIDPILARPFLIGFADAIAVVFFIGSAVMAAAFIWVLLLPKMTLRVRSSHRRRDKGRGPKQHDTSSRHEPAHAQQSPLGRAGVGDEPPVPQVATAPAAARPVELDPTDPWPTVSYPFEPDPLEPHPAESHPGESQPAEQRLEPASGPQPESGRRRRVEPDPGGSDAPTSRSQGRNRDRVRGTGRSRPPTGGSTVPIREPAPGGSYGINGLAGPPPSAEEANRYRGRHRN